MGESSLLGGSIASSSNDNLFAEGKYIGNLIENGEKAKSILKIGNKRTVRIYTDAKFNKLQKKMWKFLLNIEIEEVN